MPNWVFNHLTIKKEYLGKIMNSDGDVDFNILSPMPDSVRNMQQDSRIETDIMYYLSNRLEISPRKMMKSKTLKDACKINPEDSLFSIRMYNVDVPEGTDPCEYYILHLYNETVKAADSKNEPDYERGKLLVDNYTKYGARTWYDWSNANWSCKWNASNSYLPEKEDENGEVTIDFDTPWCCPHGWLETLGKKKIPFYLEWIEEQGYHGEVSSDGETVVYKDLPDLTWDEDKEEYVEYKEEDE